MSSRVMLMHYAWLSMHDENFIYSLRSEHVTYAFSVPQKMFLEESKNLKFNYIYEYKNLCHYVSLLWK